MPIQNLLSPVIENVSDINGLLNRQNNLEQAIENKADINHTHTGLERFKMLAEDLTVTDDAYHLVAISPPLEKNTSYLIDFSLLMGDCSKVVYKLEIPYDCVGWTVGESSDFQNNPQVQWGELITKNTHTFELDFSHYSINNSCDIHRIDKLKIMIHTGENSGNINIYVKKNNANYPDFDILANSYVNYKVINE